MDLRAPCEWEKSSSPCVRERDGSPYLLQAQWVNPFSAWEFRGLPHGLRVPGVPLKFVQFLHKSQKPWDYTQRPVLCTGSCFPQMVIPISKGWRRCPPATYWLHFRLLLLAPSLLYRRVLGLLDEKQLLGILLLAPHFTSKHIVQDGQVFHFR